MKKIILGISFLVCGTIGTLTLIKSVLAEYNNFGRIDGSSSVFVYFSSFHLSALFYSYAVLGVVGIFISILGVVVTKTNEEIQK